MARNFKELTAKMPPERLKRVEQRLQRTMELMALHDLRRARRMNQIQVAEKLEVAQSEVSRIENRADMHISTLRDYVQALGGRLEMSAVFPEGRIAVELGRSDRS